MMILPKFEYKSARTVAEAIDLYGRFDGKAQYLAGGTDLVPLLKLRLAQPAVVIDLKNIEELKVVSQQGGALVIGANVTLFDLKNHAAVHEYFPALHESLDATSCETLQMRGTIGGNLLQDTRCLFFNKSLEWRTARGFCYKMGGETCNVVPRAQACFANYCSDNAPAFLTLSARVKLVGPRGERFLDLEKIYTEKGRGNLLVEPGEVLTQIHVPLKKTRGVYEKLRVRDSMDYPLVGVAVSLKGSSLKASVAGIGKIPRVYTIKKVDDGNIGELATQAQGDAKPVQNASLSAAYRKKMVGVLLKKAIKRTLKEANA